VQLVLFNIDEPVTLMTTRTMPFRHAENCASCNSDIPGRTRAYLNAETKTVSRLECFGAIGAVEDDLLGSGHLNQARGTFRETREGHSETSGGGIFHGDL
jgi:hypothetical protein